MDVYNPFINPTDSFNISLLKNYINPLADWFFGTSENGVFLHRTNSSWEAAYSMNFLIELDKSLLPSYRNQFSITDYTEKCKNQTFQTIKWLISSPRRLSETISNSPFSEELGRNANDSFIVYCWEKNTWDTSVVLKSIYKAIEHYGVDFIQSIREDVERTVKGAIAWLFYVFEEQKKEYDLYSFGANDFAPILSLIVTFLESDWSKNLFKRKYSNYKKIAENMAKRIIQYFDACEEKIDDDGVIKSIHWGDNFITSEVGSALSDYFRHICQKNKPDSDEVAKIYATLKHVAYWYEESQTDDGLWGAHDDTLQSLRAYLEVANSIDDYELNARKKGNQLRNEFAVENYKVFKTIRWILDEKQCMKDGSYLHTSYLTVFFSQTLIVVFRDWKFSKDENGNDKTIFSLYDQLIGTLPARMAGERAKNIQLEIDNLNLQKKILSEKESFRFLMLISFFIAGCSVVVCSLIVFNAIEIEAGKPIIENDDRLFGIVDVISMILTIILTYFVFHKFDDD